MKAAASQIKAGEDAAKADLSSKVAMEKMLADELTDARKKKLEADNKAAQVVPRSP